ncbi:hypothetical protein [Intrasporangium flavum]|uniref:hypothetical protein n=1 Tax=Intrasporangium flavum TaxID=1428657 RepID=UPI00096FDE03|nr:hypothetical protein [Intrasporangium flavum]
MTRSPDGAGHAYLAVDAGNSKTVALVVDGEGAVLGRGRGGCGDIYGASSADAALSAVFGAVDVALRTAGLAPGHVTGAAFRLAGVDFPEDMRFWDGHIARRLEGIGAWTTKNDGFASLRLVDGSGVAASITVGTGPAVAARSADGREECSGMFVFDHLGGSGLGHHGLAAVCRAWMGIGPATSLTASYLELYEVPDAWALRHAFARREGARPGSDLWRASRVVLAAAEGGDAVARRLVADQAAAFVRYAQWCARRVGVDLASGSLPVLLNGSVVTSEYPAMRDALRDRLALEAPAAPVVVSSASPLIGVVLDALAEGGVEVGPELLATVRDDHPDDFLVT